MDRSSGPQLAMTQQLLLRGVGIFVALLAIGAALSYRPDPATAENEPTPYTGTAATRELDRLYQSLDAASGELELTQLELHRATRLLDYSAQYDIPADLAATIYDEALRAGIDPDLAFQIVRLESGFNPRAVSRVGAIGLTQVMPATARFYEPEANRESLFEPEVNVRIGFRFFRELLQRYDGDVRLALLAYNRGPSRVGELLAQGRDPRNGYATNILDRYRRAGPTLP